MRDLTRRRPLTEGPGAARLEVRIDHFLLDGVGPIDASALETAIHLELGRLLGGGSAGGGSEPELRSEGSTIEIPAGAAAEVVGARIAQVVHRAVAPHIAPEGKGRR